MLVLNFDENNIHQSAAQAVYRSEGDGEMASDIKGMVRPFETASSRWESAI
jgi:hypothetical protein